VRNDDEVKVWDPLVRVFHWTLVTAFTVAFLTEDESLDLHVLAGYGVLGLVGLRIAWGLIGTRHARFGDFVHRPRVVLAYLQDEPGQERVEAALDAGPCWLTAGSPRAASSLSLRRWIMAANAWSRVRCTARRSTCSTAAPAPPWR